LNKRATESKMFSLLETQNERCKESWCF